MDIRSYGFSGPMVITLYGGPGAPGAPGSMAPVAGGLSKFFRILEPMQRGRGPEPLTVARHIADLVSFASCGSGCLHRAEGSNFFEARLAELTPCSRGLTPKS